jgi:hypothetical protein
VSPLPCVYCLTTRANTSRYVLSPTHLHEFKSADKTQAPVMSLYLPEQKLGSHSTEGHSSNKFILKGRQTGGMHRGHTWVFRAESYDTMMAWVEDIKALTEKSPEERSNFVRGHSRSFSRSSQHSTRSSSSDINVDEDEDDEPPFSATAESLQALLAIQQPPIQPRQDEAARRPEPGGRFPSDLQVNAQRGLQVPVSPSSVSSGSVTHDHQKPGHHHDSDSNEAILQAAMSSNLSLWHPQPLRAGTTLPGNDPYSSNPNSAEPDPRWYGSTERTPMDEAPSHAAIVSAEAREDGVNPYTNEPFYDPANPAGANLNNDGAMAGQQVSAGVGVDSYRQSAVENHSPQRDSVQIPGAMPETPGVQLYPTRPSETVRKASEVPTISMLHVPGEYPKSTPGSSNV